jgi:flagellar motor switch protein FliG
MNLNDKRLHAYTHTDSGKQHHEKKTPDPASVTPPHREKTASDVLSSEGLLKVRDTASSQDGKESIFRRVAKFLLIIGVDEAAKILPHLTEEQTEKIIPEIASIRSVEPDEASAILAEFQALVVRAREGGGVETAHTILEKAFGEDKAREMFEKAVPFPAGRPFEYLDDMDSERVYLLLKDESVAVTALVLSHLKPKTAAAVITRMPADEKTKIVYRLAKMEAVLPEVLRRIDHSMHEKLLLVNTSKSENLDGRNALAQILKKMSPENEQSILGTLSEEDPDLGQDLRSRLFTIDDILDSDDRFIQNYLRKMQDGDIAILIAGKPDAFRRKILTNVSKSRAAAIEDEEQIRSPVLRRDSEKITSSFFSAMRRAFEAGDLIVKGRSDDIYV